jgi:hypothetical protein
MSGRVFVVYCASRSGASPPEEMVIPGETPKTMSPRLYVPKYQIARRQGVFSMSLSGNWLILVDFQDQHADDGLGCRRRWLFSKRDAPDLEDSPDREDGLLQDPGV